MSEKGEAIERDLNQAISDVLSRHEKSMVTRWVAMVEIMDENGDRGIWTFTAPEATAWDTLGMLTYGIQMEQAAVVQMMGDDPE